MHGSQLHSYSIGLAAENKPLRSRILNVTPVEQLPSLDGEIAFNPTDSITVGEDSEGNRYEVKTVMDITLSCEWLPMGSNRVTPPDIRRGELVEVYQLGDSDQYFWRPLGLRDHLRRLETVIYAFNANPTEDEDNQIDINNCYFLEVSTHNRTITLGTSQANGEPFQYTLQLNAGAGLVTLVDDIGNLVELDSSERSILAQNADESFIQLDKRTVRAESVDGGYLEVNPEQTYLQSAAGAYVDIQGTKIDANAADGITLTAGTTTLELTTSGTTLTTPSFEGKES